MNSKQKEEYKKSLNLTLNLFKEGSSIPEIAYKRKLAFSTIENHLQKLLEDKKIAIEELLDKEKIELIKKAIKDNNSLKEIKLKLPEDISYGEIRYVLTFLGKLKTRKTPIESAVNVYLGNYCYRKCFNHDDILSDCFKKFDDLIKKMENAPINFKEFHGMMKSNDLRICKLSFDERKKYVSWNYFEYLREINKDFWDLIGENG